MNNHILRNIKVISLFNLCTDFVFFAPVAIIIFQKITGSYALGMSIFSIAYVSSALFEVPTGVISDMVGRKRTVILGAFCSVLCVIFYAIGTFYWIMVLGAFFQGLSRSFYSGNNDALLYDTLKQTGKEEKYQDYLGKLSSLFQVALGIASIIGGFIASYSFSVVMWISVIPQLGCLLLSFFIIEPTVVSNKSTNIYDHLNISLKKFKENFRLQLLAISDMINFALGESAFFLRATFINMVWPLWALGVFSLLTHFSGFLSFYFSGKVIKKLSPKFVLNFEILYGRIANFIALLFPSGLSPIFIASTSLNFGLGIVARNSLMQKEFTQEQRATMASMSAFLGSIMFGIVSILLGFSADKIGVIYTLLLTNFVLFLPLIFYKKIFRPVI